MPDQGVNSVYAAARANGRLEAFDFNVARHPVIGAPTLNVGTLHGGINVNSVPDRAKIGIDIRTIPRMRHAPFEGGWLKREFAYIRRVMGDVGRGQGLPHVVERPSSSPA